MVSCRNPTAGHAICLGSHPQLLIKPAPLLSAKSGCCYPRRLICENRRLLCTRLLQSWGHIGRHAWRRCGWLFRRSKRHLQLLCSCGRSGKGSARYWLWPREGKRHCRLLGAGGNERQGHSQPPGSRSSVCRLLLRLRSLPCSCKQQTLCRGLLSSKRWLHCRGPCDEDWPGWPLRLVTDWVWLRRLGGGGGTARPLECDADWRRHQHGWMRLTSCGCWLEANDGDGQGPHSGSGRLRLRRQ